MKHVAILLGAAALAACASLPGKSPQEIIKPQSAFASAQTFAAPAGAWPTGGWWKAYGDPQLDALIEEALAGSPSVAIADARLRRARASQDGARGALAPTVSANSTFTEQKQSYNYLSPAAMTPQGWDDYGRSSWISPGNSTSGARIARRSRRPPPRRWPQVRTRTRHDWSCPRAIASSYAELARLYSALDTAKAAQRSAHQDGGAVRQALRQWPRDPRQPCGRRMRAARPATPKCCRSRSRSRCRRTDSPRSWVRAPIAGWRSRVRNVEFTRAFALPATLSADLIGRRPDLVAARLRAEAAAKRIHVTRAQFYPNVNLIRLHRRAVAGPRHARRRAARTSAASGPAISLPIFNGGRLRGAAARRRGRVRRGRGQLRQGAGRRRCRKWRTPPSRSARSRRRSSASMRPWRPRARPGACRTTATRAALRPISKCSVAEDYLLTNLRTQSDLRSRSMSLDVALNRALGGGYNY